jgi:hypothetical protein
MDRRWWGAFVIALVLLASLVVPNIVGSRLAGRAARTAIPAPPQVGMCLLADPSASHAALDLPNMRVQSGAVGPCGDANYGEVVWVQDAGEARSRLVGWARELVPYQCRKPASRYLGWQPLAPSSQTGPTSTTWLAAATAKLIRLGPDQAQYRAGQGWLACVMLPRFAPYAGSARGGTSEAAMAAFGSCHVAAGGSAQTYVPCDEPHRSEIFGLSPIDPAQVQVLFNACKELITRVTGMLDPTAGGALTVSVEAIEAPGNEPQQPPAPTPGYCAIRTVGDRLLAASLLGIGARPLPWVR